MSERYLEDFAAGWNSAQCGSRSMGRGRSPQTRVLEPDTRANNLRRDNFVPCTIPLYSRPSAMTGERSPIRDQGSLNSALSDLASADQVR